jgi:hypothetical protein
VCCILIPKHSSGVCCVVVWFQNISQVLGVLRSDSKTFLGCFVCCVLIPKHLPHEQRVKHRCLDRT